MLPTSRASSKTIISLGSSIPSFLLPSYSTWSSLPSPPPPRTQHQRRSSSSSTIDAHSSPFYPPTPSLFESLRSLSESLQNDLDVKESSRWVGRALEKDFVSPATIRIPPPPTVPEETHKYHVVFVDVGGRSWSSKEIVLAYAWGLGDETVSRRRTNEEESSSNATEEEAEETVDDLANLENGPAGIHLREVLSLLHLDDETFLLWRKVVRSSSVREALSLLQLQTVPSTLSPRGDPLWPHWLITIVMGRSESSLDAHLSIALMAHHLPWLSQSPTRQAILFVQALEIVARFELLAAVPEMVNLALTGKFLEMEMEEEEEKRREEGSSCSSSSSSQKASWKPRWTSPLSSSELDVGRHISTSTTPTTSVIPPRISDFLYDFDGTQRWHKDDHPAQFFATIIRILTSFPGPSPATRRAASPVLTSQLSLVLSHMLAKSIPLLPHSYDQLFRARFLADENLKALLFDYADRSGLEKPMRYVNALMIAAVEANQKEVANDCADALDEMAKERRKHILERDLSANKRPKLGRNVQRRPVETFGASNGEEEEERWKALVMSEEDQAANRFELFSSYSVHFLSGIQDASAAVEYLETLRLPPRSSLDYSQARGHAARAFAVLCKIMATAPSSNTSSSDLLRILEHSNLFVTGRLRIAALDGVMKGLLARKDHLEVFRLWQRTIEEERLTPNVSLLRSYLWASSEFETLAAGIKMMDQWSVRQGVHRIIHRGIDGPFVASNQDPNIHTLTPSLDHSQVLVHLSPSPPLSSLSSSSSSFSSSPFDLTPSLSSSQPPAVRVQLNGHILTSLLTSLGHLADPGRSLEVAFRIWDAAGPRWGVTQSIEMLNELLESAAFVYTSEWITRSGKVREWETRHLDVRLVEMDLPKEHELDEDGGIDWAKVDVERFFALPPPSPLEEGEVDEELWTRPKWLFEEIVTSNWPFLVDIPHPFDDLYQSTRLPPILGVKPYSPPPSDGLKEEVDDLSHLSTLPPSHTQNLPPLLSSPSRIAATLPPPSLYSHLYPTSQTFHYYVLVLLYKKLFDEVPFAFAWMRHLSIYPQRRTIVEALAVLAIESKQGERRLREMKEGKGGWMKEGWRNLKDGGKRGADGEEEDELLRVWLELWLGVEGVPGREEVGVRWGELESRKKRIESWNEFEFGV